MQPLHHRFYAPQRLAVLFTTSLLAEQTTKTSDPRTSASPCPFMNTVIANHELGASASVDDIVFYAQKYGVDAKLAHTLANGAAENGVVTFSKFLDNQKRPFPVHIGSMARNDADLSQVDPRRIAALKQSSKDGVYITEKELEHFYDTVNKISICIDRKPMSFRDYIPHYAERELLMGLFRSYIDTSESGEKRLPLDLLVNFLEKNELPEDFEKSHIPATVSSVIFTLVRNAHHILYKTAKSALGFSC